SADYYPKLQPSQFLTGPAEGWQYFHGVWAPAYEGIRVVERGRGPFALWGGAKFKDGAIEANVTLPGAVELAGILFRASAAGDGARGYEVVFDPRKQQLSLRRNGDQSSPLAEAEMKMSAREVVRLRIECDGPRIKVIVNDSPLMEMTDKEAGIVEGSVGVRAWGGSLWLDGLTIRSPGGGNTVVPSGEPAPAYRALQSLCLMLFNLNEFIYVD
ncbi:MAG TPA: family 16 glycoside hydrolase, partial [Verrucomicrobiales bacterium]|nr:family 16 glycoside hydrolase [Verrucomicrobiales bacterium]